VIQLIISILVGAGLLFLLYALARKGTKPEGGAQALIEARQALNELKHDLLPHEVVARIFAKDDLDYVLSAAPEDVVRLFLQQRKRIALSWVDRVRGQVVRLKRFHLGRSRSYARLRLRAEIALTMDFATLLFACRVLQILVFLRGPYAAPQMIGTTVGIVEKVCGVSEASLAFLDSTNTASLDGQSAGTVAGV
jgi:hypothetical protein